VLHPGESSSVLQLRFAARRRKRAEQERHDASAELRAAVLDAYEAGVPITRIAREAEISRQAVYEMLGIRLLSGRPK
jgi:DNA invertase Pin-like site-specific DNA recombinase